MWGSGGLNEVLQDVVVNILTFAFWKFRRSLARG